MTEDYKPEELPPSMPVVDHEPSPWKLFFNLIGGSVIYCLSAMSILYGLSKILSP